MRPGRPALDYANLLACLLMYFGRYRTQPGGNWLSDEQESAGVLVSWDQVHLTYIEIKKALKPVD